MQRKGWWFELDNDTQDEIIGVGWDLPGIQRERIPARRSRREVAALAVAVLLAVACYSSAAAQPPVGASPKEALNSKTYQSLRVGASSVPADEFRAKINSLERAHMRVEALQHSILDQLDNESRASAELRMQVATDTANLATTAERLRLHEAAQLSAPSTIAVLQNEVQWLRALGLLILGSTGLMIKQLRDTARLLAAVNASYNQLISHHGEVLGRLTTVENEAHRAYHEANTVNEKIRSLGVEIRDRAA